MTRSLKTKLAIRWTADGRALVQACTLVWLVHLEYVVGACC